MRRDSRAVVFDLDDTLYPFRRFRLSGFLAVAEHLSKRSGLDVRVGVRTLVRASRGHSRGAEIQACLEQHELPAAWLPELVEVLRYHTPKLRLARATTRVLQDLREKGWRLGVLTNGAPSIQLAKIDALGLRALVDVIACATTVGRGTGKPDGDAFAHMARALSVPLHRAVHVGDDEVCDVAGARAAGLSAVRCLAWTGLQSPTSAQAVVHRLADIPEIAAALIEEASNRHAA
jgi:putative hydrolase of the HAD superfamily